MFLPTQSSELKSKQCDIILITGDAYIDSPFIGVSVIGKILANEGYTVGVIGQPDITNAEITRLGEPKLFWGVTGGSIDSMVANFTALKKRRKTDDYTPGGLNNKRPDKAIIVYTNLIKKYYKNTVPIILGGLEASLRRISHYDYITNTIRRSILFDSKADYLIYGMAEKAVLETAKALKNKASIKNINGLCYISNIIPDNSVILPSYNEVKKDKDKFTKMFLIFYNNTAYGTSKTLCQKHDTRYLIQNPPQKPLTENELDKIYELDYERDAHPYYKSKGIIKALETIKFSVTTHRGCFGECNFCSIALHQGKRIISRSQKSILKEIIDITKLKDFKGYITDIGGPTANMYGMDCKKNFLCSTKRCLHPSKCVNININHSKLIDLLSKIRQIKNIKKVFVCSGIRYDLIFKDSKYGEKYLNTIIKYHTSGQLKIAPESINSNILNLMGKPCYKNELERFINIFYQKNQEFNLNQFLTYYLMAYHPGSNYKDLKIIKNYFKTKHKTNPKQIQNFTPSPSTFSTLMYYTEKNPFTNEKIFVEKNLKKKNLIK